MDLLGDGPVAENSQGSEVDGEVDEDSLADALLAMLPLERVDPDDDNQMKQVHLILRRCPMAQRHYLFDLGFPVALAHAPNLLSATAQELGGPTLFSTRLGFSGTPNDLIPRSMGKVQYDPNHCDGKVAVMLSRASVVTASYLMPADWTPNLLLRAVGSAKPSFHALIDCGALVTGISNLAAAHILLRELPADPFEGVVFLHDTSDERLILLRDGMRVTRLSTCGLPPHRRFTFYDHIHTTGMDIPQSPSACAALTLGKDTAFRDYAQAAYRMRRMGKGHMLALLIPPSVGKLIDHAANTFLGGGGNMASGFTPKNMQDAPEVSLLDLMSADSAPNLINETPADNTNGTTFDPPARLPTAQSGFNLLIRAPGTNDEAERGRHLLRVLVWVMGNTLISERKQAKLLYEQNVAGLYRGSVWNELGTAARTGSANVTRCLNVLREPVRDSVPNNPRQLENPDPLGTRLESMLNTHQEWVTPEQWNIGQAFIAEANQMAPPKRLGNEPVQMIDLLSFEAEQVEETFHDKNFKIVSNFMIFVEISSKNRLRVFLLPKS